MTRSVRNSEVEQFRNAVIGDDDVAGLDVAMHDQILMRVLHRAAHRAKQGESLVNAQRTRFAVIANGFSRHVLHDEIRYAVGCCAAVEQTRDVRMFKCRQNLSFMTKAGENCVGIHPALDQLDGNPLRKLSVITSGEIHRAHAAATNLFQQSVGSNAFPHR